MQEDIKWSKLELDNRDDIYNKIFAKGKTTMHEIKQLSNNFDRTTVLRPETQKTSQSKDAKGRRIGKGLPFRARASECKFNRNGEESSMFQFMMNYR